MGGVVAMVCVGGIVAVVSGWSCGGGVWVELWW